LDVALVACLLCSLLQLVPLPVGWRQALSPHAATVDQALRFDGGIERLQPLTINAAATTKAAVVATLVLLLFWATREALRYGGARNLTRLIAWAGLAVSAIAIVVRASRTQMIYGFWSTGYNTEPYGPFINRNHMGSWLVMALPLVAGYIVTRFDRQRREKAAAIDAMMLWLVAAAAAMLAAAIVSLSRSTAVGIATAGLFGAAMARRRRLSGAPWLVAAAATLAVLIALSIPRTVELADRFQDSKTTATWARPQIWRETLPIVRDFPITGSGLGTFATAMLVYQQADRTIFFNQAHNQYLQFAAEGGLLLIVPLIAAAVAFASIARRHLAEDRTAAVWTRTGAIAGIVGVLVQSVWETGLRLPANGLLFAVLCAIAIHERNDP
jgi:O-antigen ligase